MTSKSSGDFPVKLNFRCSPGERKPAEPRWVGATVEITRARCREGRTPRRRAAARGGWGCFSRHTPRNSILKFSTENTSCCQRSPPAVGWAGGSGDAAQAPRGLHQLSRKRRRRPLRVCSLGSRPRGIDVPAPLALGRVLSCRLSPRICISGSRVCWPGAELISYAYPVSRETFLCTLGK